jgi:hypothetical protein
VNSRGRMPSHLTSCKLSSTATRTTTSRNNPRTCTSTKPKLLPVQTCTGLTGVVWAAASPTAFRSPQARTVLTLALALGICR